MYGNTWIIWLDSVGLILYIRIAWKLDEVKYKYKYKSEQEKAIDDADFGEVQQTIGDAVITKKGIINADKDRFYLPKSLIDKFDGRTGSVETIFWIALELSRSIIQYVCWKNQDMLD